MPELEYHWMDPAELPRLADIDRQENVYTGYAIQDGQLTPMQVDWEVPSFFREGQGEHSLAAQIAFCQRHVQAGAILLGVNEFTFLKAPPAGLVSLLTGTLGIHTFRQDEWESILRKAGFANVTSSVYSINLWEQLASHIESDGLKNYLAAIMTGVRDTSIRSTFFTKEMLAVARDFLPYVGYGLYKGQKVHEEPCRA